MPENDLPDTGFPKCNAAQVKEDRAALMALYDATDGDNWTNNDELGLGQASRMSGLASRQNAQQTGHGTGIWGATNLLRGKHARARWANLANLVSGCSLVA